MNGKKLNVLLVGESVPWLFLLQLYLGTIRTHLFFPQQSDTLNLLESFLGNQACEKIPKTDLGEGGLEWKIKPPTAYQLYNLGLGTWLSFSGLGSLPGAEIL